MPAPPAATRLSVPAVGPWADRLGYARAIRVGCQIWVSGTGPYDPTGNIVGADDPQAQTAYIIAIIGAALRSAGADLRHVVRTRIYLRSFADAEAVCRAHRDGFAGRPPAATVIGVGDLAHPLMRVYMDADALIDEGEAISKI